MDTSEFDNEVERLEAEKERRSVEGEAIAERFVKMMQDRIVSWASAFIENTVKTETEVTKKLGVEKLRQLKAATSELLEKLPATAKDAFNKESYWPLRIRTRGSKDETDNFHQRFAGLNTYLPLQLPVHLSRAEEEAQKPVVDFLKQFGYRAPVVSSFPKKQAVLFNDYAFTQDAIKLLIEYSKIHGLRWKVISDIESIKAKKESAEAADLWDQA